MLFEPYATPKLMDRCIQQVAWQLERLLKRGGSTGQPWTEGLIFFFLFKVNEIYPVAPGGGKHLFLNSSFVLQPMPRPPRDFR